MTFIHLLIEAVYLLCPMVALVRAIRLSTKSRRPQALRNLRLTAISGTGAGIIICVLYASLLDARLIFTQVLLTAYLATSLMLLLQLFDHALWQASQRVFRLRRHRGPTWWYTLRAVTALLVRVAVVFCVGLPYVLAAVLTYRPKVATPGDPLSMYNWNYTRVQFPATDGTRIVGWWIPAPGGESRQTVLLCPGSAANKSSQLFLVKRLVPDGYNVLVFDFRAHGESGGQLCTFGDLERKDVLGAVRWLRKNHPDAARQVAGIGVSSGGAALLAAAADPSVEGQVISAIAVYDTFDRLDNEVAALVELFIPTHIGWFVQRLGLPMAGVQVGTHLADFSPASEIQNISARPLLFIHGTADEFVPFEQGQSLYDAAAEPKLNYWIDQSKHEPTLQNEGAMKFVRKWFDTKRTTVRLVI